MGVRFWIAAASAVLHAALWVFKGRAWAVRVLVGLLALVVLFWFGGGVVWTAIESGWGSRAHRFATFAGAAIIAVNIVAPVLVGAGIGMLTAFLVLRRRSATTAVSAAPGPGDDPDA